MGSKDEITKNIIVAAGSMPFIIGVFFATQDEGVVVRHASFVQMLYGLFKTLEYGIAFCGSVLLVGGIIYLIVYLIGLTSTKKLSWYIKIAILYLCCFGITYYALAKVVSF